MNTFLADLGQEVLDKWYPKLEPLFANDTRVFKETLTVVNLSARYAQFMATPSSPTSLAGQAILHLIDFLLEVVSKSEMYSVDVLDGTYTIGDVEVPRLYVSAPKYGFIPPKPVFLSREDLITKEAKRNSNSKPKKKTNDVEAKPSESPSTLFKKVSQVVRDFDSRNPPQEVVDKLKIYDYYAKLMQSAASRGIKFTLKVKDLKKLLKQESCYYSGVAFESYGENVFTVDRLDPDKGYTKKNTVACTSKMNQLKSVVFERTDVDLDAMIKMAKVMKGLSKGDSIEV